MKLLITLLISTLLLSGQSPTGVVATAQCESINSNVLGIRDLNTCDIGLTNYSSGTVVVTEAMIRQFFPTLDIENQARAQAVADKAFANSKKSRTIAVLNFASPFAVALMGGGLIGMSVGTALKAVTATSLANTAAQAFKGYLIGQQPNEAAFLPNLPAAIVLAPYGTMSNGQPTFSGVWTVLGSIAYTNGIGGMPVSASKKHRGRVVIVPVPVLTWHGELPSIQPRLSGDVTGCESKPALPNGTGSAGPALSMIIDKHEKVNEAVPVVIPPWIRNEIMGL